MSSSESIEMKKQRHDSFETTEYGSGMNVYEKYSTIHQIVEENGHKNPEFGIKVALTGNVLKLYYHAIEQLAPTRMKEIEKRAHDALNEAVRYIKKEYKSRTKAPLDMKEMRDRANSTIQKITLNERYYYVSWRFFELG